MARSRKPKRKHHSSAGGGKQALKMALIAAAAGAGAGIVQGYAVQNIEMVKNNWWAPGGLAVAAGLLLANRGKKEIGMALAGAGGYSLYFNYLIAKANKEQQTKSKDTPGFTFTGEEFPQLQQPVETSVLLQDDGESAELYDEDY